MGRGGYGVLNLIGMKAVDSHHDSAMLRRKDKDSIVHVKSQVSNAKVKHSRIQMVKKTVVEFECSTCPANDRLCLSFGLANRYGCN